MVPFLFQCRTYSYLTLYGLRKISYPEPVPPSLQNHIQSDKPNNFYPVLSNVPSKMFSRPRFSVSSWETNLGGESTQSTLGRPQLWFFSLKTFARCFTNSRVCDKSIISDTTLNVGLFFGLMLMVICNLLILMQYLCSWKLISSFNNSFSDKI